MCKTQMRDSNGKQVVIPTPTPLDAGRLPRRLAEFNYWLPLNPLTPENGFINLICEVICASAMEEHTTIGHTLLDDYLGVDGASNALAQKWCRERGKEKKELDSGD